MVFHTQCGHVRPVRLSEETRQFSYDSFNRKYGLDTLRLSSVEMADVTGFVQLTPIEQYNGF